MLLVGVLASVGLSFALGIGEGVQSSARTVGERDGQEGLEPGSSDLASRPLRSSRIVQTAYGPLTITTFLGDQGMPLEVDGIPELGAPGAIEVSRAVAQRLEDDWSGELRAQIDVTQITGELDRRALATPNELLVVAYVDEVSVDKMSSFHPIVRGGRYSDSSFVVVGVAILALPSLALAVSGARLHLNRRAARYALFRLLGMTPRRMQLVITADLGVALLLGAVAGAMLYQAMMTTTQSFGLVGTSYWSEDLKLDLSVLVVVVGVVVAAGVLSPLRLIRRAGRDPLGQLQRQRHARSSWTALGVIVGPASIYWALATDAKDSVWIVTAGLAVAVVGFVGLARVGVAAAGRILVKTSRHQLSGARMWKSSSETLLGTTAAMIAIVLVVFSTTANFSGRSGSGEDFDVLVDLPAVRDTTSLVTLASEITGVERVVSLGRFSVMIGDREGSMFVLSCSEADGIVQLSGPCRSDAIYTTMATGVESFEVSDANLGSTGEIDGIYPNGGRASAIWLLRGQSVLISSTAPLPPNSQMLVITDGTPGSLRRVLESLGDLPEVESFTTSAALEAGVDADTLVLDPYLQLMAVIASVMGAAALAFGAIMMFRQREVEFVMLRCLGVTRAGLSAELGILFGVPLVIAFLTAVAVGGMLSGAYNSGLSVSSEGIGLFAPLFVWFSFISVAAVVAVMAAAFLVDPDLQDPDATV